MAEAAPSEGETQFAEVEISSSNVTDMRTNVKANSSDASGRGVRQNSEVKINPVFSAEECERYGTIELARYSVDTKSEYDENQLRSRSVSRSPLPYAEQAKARNNTLFGMPKWHTKAASSDKSEARDSKKTRYTSRHSNRFASVGNLLYVVFFGWWIALLYLILGCIMWLTMIGQDYTEMCWDLSAFMFWPFGKYLCEHRHSPTVVGTGHDRMDLFNERTTLLMANDATSPAPSQSGTPTPSHDEPGKKTEGKLSTSLKRPGFFVWMLFCPILWIAHGIVVIVCGFFVILIPMAKIQWLTITKLLFFDPARIHVIHKPTELSESADILMCTYQAINIYYYKYTIEGMNICLVNLMAFVVLAILLGHIRSFEAAAGRETVFVLALLSVIPLAYYIGMSIANISATSNFAVGAVLNATFGSVVELILYYQALQKGLKVLVKAALTGTLLGTMLFLPGLFMVIGGLKFDEQKFNLKSAGVSSSLLFVSVAGAYSPSLFQMVFGAHRLTCNEPVSGQVNLTAGQNCYWRNLDDVEMEEDPIYTDKTKKLVWFCCALLPLAYVIGLLYTLRTHVHHIYKSPKDEDHNDGHHLQHGPLWSKVKSISILLVSTILLAVVAEEVVNNMEPIIESAGVSEEAMGLIVVALLPDIAEIINGIQFARQNNIALSIEVVTSLAVQVCLLQMPILVLLSEAFLANQESVDHFTLVFPSMYTFTVFFSVILMNYIFQDGKSDYFQGGILLIIYGIMVGIILF